MNDSEILKPRERTCELCGRQEEWTEQNETWQVVREDGDPVVGNRYCIHEWDINGTFVPVKDPNRTASA